MQDKQKAILDEIVNINKQFNCLSEQLNVLVFHCNELVGFRNQISESIEKLIVVTQLSVDNVSVNPVAVNQGFDKPDGSLVAINSDVSAGNNRSQCSLEAEAEAEAEADIEQRNVEPNALLSSVQFQKEFLSLQSFLLKNYGDSFTCGEFLTLTDMQLLSLPHFGVGKLELASQMKRLIKSGSVSSDEISDDGLFSWPDRDELSEWVVNYVLLTEPQRKLMDKVARDINVSVSQLNLANLIYDVDPSLMKAIVAGVKFNLVYEDLLVNVKAEFDVIYGKTEDELKRFITGGRLLGYVGSLNFTSFEMSKIISNDLDAFLSNEDERLVNIVRSRFGIDGNKRSTLEAIANVLPDKLTRERVRQLQVDATQRLLSSLSIQSSNIWANVRNNARPQISSSYPELAARFSDEKGFIGFLEMISQAEKKELDNLLHPDCSVDFINDLAKLNKAPLHLCDVIDNIKEQYGYTEQQAINGLYGLQERGELSIDADNVFPRSLNKQEAFSQAALFFPLGASFKDIHALANEQNYCKSIFPLDRQDHGVSMSVDEGFVYLSGHGTYRHTSYLEFSDQDKERVLASVQNVLQASSRKGIDTLNLRVDVYEKAGLPEDYFTVRHIVREYGFERSIFFAGKSGADTVSLEPEFSLKGQKEAIVEMFEKDPKPRTRGDIVNVIRSRSFGHAGFYISELISEGRLVRIDAEHYDLPHIAFADKPVTLIMDRASVILHRADRPVEVGVIAEECNTRLHLEYPKAWYISLLRYYAEKYRKNWYFYHNIVAVEPLNGMSLHSCAKSWLSKISDDDAIIDNVYCEILADKAHIRQAVQNIRSSCKFG